MNCMNEQQFLESEGKLSDVVVRIAAKSKEGRFAEVLSCPVEFRRNNCLLSSVVFEGFGSGDIVRLTYHYTKTKKRMLDNAELVTEDNEVREALTDFMTTLWEERIRS